MAGAIETLGELRVLVLDRDGPILATERDGTDLIGDAMGEDARWLAIPVERLSEDFLKLSTGLAGTILQKAVNYRINVAIVGDVSAKTAASKPLNDFVGESNRGRHVWFVRDLDELRARLD
ncbi:DUF4180 domain-containing protein [Caulobacter mirabilis]|uniref:Alpha/beta hydrolase n=1 Tax=Caulobacter mirabilis TaxID=69666 RepID=A0A2D2AV71_9CAUL|nr:DUF4180 domain-containing protein [Caulobacter mirabilis]ATQ41871.1 alpha/beta hydrolase [Caulobacter mirabilis]